MVGNGITRLQRQSMWPFIKYYSILDSGILDGATDWHCHILPGVDDGIRTMDEALAVIAYYEHIGIREVWLTPHIMEDVPNDPVTLQNRFAQLEEAYHAWSRTAVTPEHPAGRITFHLAAENMIDTLFDRRLETGQLLSIGGSATIPGMDGEMLLVETSYFNPPLAFEQTLAQIKLHGFHPLLAHPERYAYMGRRDFIRLKEAGVRFQLNLMSLVGMYGQLAADNASRLLLDGLYDYAGSDLHRLSPWQSAIHDKSLTKKELAALQSLRARMDAKR